jgi:hypothetical protein
VRHIQYKNSDCVPDINFENAADLSNVNFTGQFGNQRIDPIDVFSKSLGFLEIASISKIHQLDIGFTSQFGIRN